MEGLKISVVTITLNRRDFLEKAIQSVLAQNYPNFEHIVIDGGSTDGSVEVLKQYTHIKWISEPDNGQADAMNKGLRYITGDYFGWLNSDDTYPAGTFDFVNKYVSEFSDTDMIYGKCNIVDKFGRVIGKTNYHPFNFRRVVMGFNNINTPAVFVKTRTLKAAGNFDTNLRATYDIDMWIRVAKIGNVVSVPEVLSNLCLHDGSGLVSSQLHLNEVPKLREKYWVDREWYERLIIYPFYKIGEDLFYAIKFKRLNNKMN